MVKIQVFVLLFIIFFGCSSPRNASNVSALPIQYFDHIIIISGPLAINKDLILDRDVLIMPSALISTENGSKLYFKGKINILGESQVFDETVNCVFLPGTLSELNVSWFGARGYDNADDTRAVAKTIQLAVDSENSVTINVPVGKFLVSETLVVKNESTNRKSINWQGSAMSNNSIQGSTFCWNGITGGTMIRFSDVNQFLIENLDFTAEPNSRVKHNLEFKPYVHQVMIRNCSFSGATGAESANINFNSGNGEQVSEVHFENCSFNGVPIGSEALTQSAVIGGYANTKNFHFENSAFSAYQKAAIDINISDILRVEGCTFANNEIDISCLLCGTYAVSNYSEHSRAFFNGSNSGNISFTTLMNNIFVGSPAGGFVIRDGCGSLVLINNDFGGADQLNDENRIRWESSEFNPIYSIGNFYKNGSHRNYPFYNRSGQVNTRNVMSIGDTGGKNSLGKLPISN